MPIFKDTVALEASPAKTAESVSYGATFAVLGWLVVSNFSGTGHAGMESSSIVAAQPMPASESQSALSNPMASTISENALPASTAGLSTDSLASARLAAQTEIASYPSLAELAAWHSSLKQEQLPADPLGHRVFSASAWDNSLQSRVQLTGPFIEDLSSSLPQLVTEFRIQSDITPELASLEGAGSGPIREITITGSETSRLISRPENISRPQLPRPYRAAEVQRSLILPPRIQALRP